MARVIPTPATLKAAKPRFAAVPDVTVQAYIDRASYDVDATWTEGDYAEAITLLACHLMTLEGLGTGAEAEANLQGLSGFKSMKSGQLDLTRFDKGSGGSSVPDPYGQTSYGQQFYALLVRNQSGPIVAGGSYACGAANARDWPHLPGLASAWPGNG